jgi:hypothetical protein
MPADVITSLLLCLRMRGADSSPWFSVTDDRACQASRVASTGFSKEFVVRVTARTDHRPNAFPRPFSEPHPTRLRRGMTTIVRVLRDIAYESSIFAESRKTLNKLLSRILGTGDYGAVLLLRM